jgi:stringent starvation protein B
LNGFISMSDIAPTSTRPYLIRALHEWCTDNGYTPYIAAHVDASVQVPVEFVKDSEIVLNVSYDATSGLKLGNEYIEFRARFGGVARDIMVPIDHVAAIYARENGQGMAFPPPLPAPAEPVAEAPAGDSPASTVQLVLASGDEAAAKAVAKPAAKARIVPKPDAADSRKGDGDEPPPSPPSGSRPSLKLVK